MAISPVIHAVFGHFQNLNLLGLLQDLRVGRTARQAWHSGSLLCPVAHGLPRGAEVKKLRALGQSADLDAGCAFAAQHLGAKEDAVFRFVRFWDEGAIRTDWLLGQLEEMWQERLEDAVVTQELIQPRSQKAAFAGSWKQQLW
jgi:hypothetical protein